MRRALLTIVLLAGFFLSHHSQAQDIRREDFGRLDSAIARLGPMQDSSLGAIARSLTGLCHNQAEMVHAYYYWMAINIEFDCKAWHHPAGQNNSATLVLQERKAVAEGYAETFRQLCGLGHIPCQTVRGWAKSFPSDIGTVRDRQRHCWNIVSINDRWYAMDVAWAAGGTDKKVRHFTKEYSDAWYGTNRRLFALCHYPDNKRQQILDTPLTKTVYSQAPVIGPRAVGLDIFPDSSPRGRLRSQGTDSVILLQYWVNKPEKIRGLSLFTETGGMQPIDYDLQGNTLTVRLPVGEEKLYEASLFIGGGLAFAYQVQGRKKKVVR